MPANVVVRLDFLARLAENARWRSMEIAMTIERFKISPEAKPYVDALRELIRSGAQASPTLETSVLVGLPVVHENVGASASPSRRAATFVELLERVIKQRLSGKSQEAALTLFAFGVAAGVPMTQRYRLVAKMINSHWTWENYRKEPLDRLLLEVYLALFREGDVRGRGIAKHSNALGTGRETPSAGNGDYALISREVIYNLPESAGRPREIIDVREIETTADGVEVWRQNFYHWGKGAASTPTATLFGPGELSVTQDSRLKTGPLPGRTYNLEVRFPEPLRTGERVRFAIYRRQETAFDELVRPEWHDGWCFTPVLQTNSFSLAIRFPRDRRPSKVWHYEDLPEKLAPGVPTDSNILTPDASGFVSFSWNEPRIGYSCGIEWEW